MRKRKKDRRDKVKQEKEELERVCVEKNNKENREKFAALLNVSTKIFIRDKY